MTTAISTEPAERPGNDRMFVDMWFTPGRFAFILAACIFAAYPEVVLGMRTFFFRDFGYFGYPLAFHHQESFWRGEIPLWNPLNNCGLPFLAQWNTLVLYPGSLFYLVFPLAWALPMFCLLHQFLAGVGMYFLAARWTRNRWAAGIAGMVFAFNGLALNSLMWPNNIAALGWMPWVVWRVEQAWHQRGGRTMSAAIFATMQMLAGAPEVILFTWTVLIGIVAVQIVSCRTSRAIFLGRFMSVVPRVTGLAAAQLLPFIDLLAHSQRDSSFGQSSWSMPGTGWANFLVPLFHCFSANQGVFFQYEQWWTSSYYVGIGPLVLALFAVGQLREPNVQLWAGLAAVSLILALGDNGYFYQWLRHAVPQFGFLRYPIKFVVLAIFCLPLLTAHAIRRLHAQTQTHMVVGRRMVLGGWAVTSALLVALLWFAHRYPYHWDEWTATWQNGLVREAFFTAFVALLIAALRMAGLRLGLLLQVALLFLVWLDLITHAPRQNPTVPAAAYNPGYLQLSPAPGHGVSRAMITRAAELKFGLTSTSEGLSHYVGNRLGLFSNCNLLDDIPKVNGFFSLYLREADQVWALLYLSGNTNLSPLLDFLNVSHITAPGTFFDWETRTNFLPFVTAGQRPVFTDDPTALRSLAAPDFRPGELVYLPLSARSMVTAGATSARIISSRFTAQRGEIEVDTQDRSLVVISQAYYPAWRAFLDGQPVPIWRANYAFQAVETPAGRHHLDLVYRDWFFVLGVAISAATLLTCLVSCWKLRFSSSMPVGLVAAGL